MWFCLVNLGSDNHHYVFYKHIVKNLLEFTRDWSHLSLHVLIISRSHHNNQNFFHFVIVVSNWSHGSILSSAKTCSSFLGLIRATISPCFQFCYHGFFITLRVCWIWFAFFFLLPFFFDDVSMLICTFTMKQVLTSDIEVCFAIWWLTYYVWQKSKTCCKDRKVVEWMHNCVPFYNWSL